MKRYIHQLVILAILLVVASCGKKEVDPLTQLPSYLRVPANLSGYEGSGLITVTGDLTLRAEGPEVVDPTTKTYSGVIGNVSTGDITAQFTVGQPRIFNETSQVPFQYQANGQLLTLHALQPGTYPMGFKSSPTPTGARTDLILNLPGPQLYQAQLGTMTIAESTILKTQGSSNLYRLQGSFQTSLSANGTGIVSGKEYNVSGTFDLLFVD